MNSGTIACQSCTNGVGFVNFSLAATAWPARVRRVLIGYSVLLVTHSGGLQENGREGAELSSITALIGSALEEELNGTFLEFNTVTLA
jgi:hypothetical protein